MAKTSVRDLHHFEPGFFTGMNGGGWVGVDPSLTGCGLAIKNLENKVITCVLSPPKGCVGAARLDYFYEELAYLFSFPWRMYAVEGYSYGSKFSRSHALGELGGLIRLAAYRNRVPGIVVSPNSLKKFVTGSGKATIKKQQVIKEIYKRWQVDLNDDNEADAFVLAQMSHAHTTGSVAHLFQREALDSVEALAVKSVPPRHRTRSA